MSEVLETPSPDFDEAGKFLDALGGPPICFQTFDDHAADQSLARTVHGALDDRASELKGLNRRGAGVFVSVNAITPGQRRLAENVSRVRALFIDADRPDEVLDVEAKNVVQLFERRFAAEG